MRGRRGVSLRKQLNIRHRSNHTWIKRVSLPSLTPQLVFLISSFLSWFHLKMRFPRKTPSASVPRHFCVLLRFGGPRRDDDASDTCGACNVLNQTRGQTSQSVVCVSQRREEREKNGWHSLSEKKRRHAVFSRRLEERERERTRLDVCCSASKLSQRHTFKPKILFVNEEKSMMMMMMMMISSSRKKNNTTTNDAPSRVSPVQTTRSWWTSRGTTPLLFFFNSRLRRRRRRGEEEEES